VDILTFCLLSRIPAKVRGAKHLKTEAPQLSEPKTMGAVHFTVGCYPGLFLTQQAKHIKTEAPWCLTGCFFKARSSHAFV